MFSTDSASIRIPKSPVSSALVVVGLYWLGRNSPREAQILRELAREAKYTSPIDWRAMRQLRLISLYQGEAKAVRVDRTGTGFDLGLSNPSFRSVVIIVCTALTETFWVHGTVKRSCPVGRGVNTIRIPLEMGRRCV